MALGEEVLGDIYRNYEHIHARWRVFDPGVDNGMLRAEDVEHNGLDA